MAGDWNPEKYQDTHRLQLEAIIEAKRQGNEIVTGTEAQPAATKVVDLMEVLSASIDSVKAARKPAKKPAKKPAARTTARKAAAKSPTLIKTTARATTAAKAKAPARRKAS
jgi:non-homologous end joining protein Ku